MSKRVLIAALPLRHQPGKFRDLLLEAGLEPVDPPREENAGELSDACVASLLPGCDAIIAGSEKLQGTLLEKCPKLRIIARTGVGYDAIDMPATNRLGITVTITPGVNQESVADPPARENDGFDWPGPDWSGDGPACSIIWNEARRF
jgi:hypothetical protein